MRDLFVCLTAFAAIVLISASKKTEALTPEGEKPNYLLMECESSRDNNFEEIIGGKTYRVVGRCFFGGYFPTGQTQQL